MQILLYPAIAFSFFLVFAVVLICYDAYCQYKEVENALTTKETIKPTRYNDH